MSSAKSTAWSRKYKDPRWQKKRLEILERDLWTCRCCMSEEDGVELHVHHGYYRLDAEGPWDYESETLWTLCRKCHKEATDDMREIRTVLARLHPWALQGPVAAGLGAWLERLSSSDSLEEHREAILGERKEA